MDPALHWLLRTGLALLLATAAFHKATAPRSFLQTLRDYRVLPDAFAPPAAAGVVAIEASLAAALLWPGRGGPAALACGLLLAVYSGAIAANLARGRRDIDCGCLGPRARQPLSGWLLARNASLILACIAAAVPPTPRPLTWVDALSIAGALCVLALLFHVSNLLVSLSAGRQRLGRST